MKPFATAKKADLIAALRRAAPALGSTQVPIFAAVLLQTSEGQLEIQATDGDLHIWTRCPAKATEPLQIAVPGGTFTKFVESMTDDVVMSLEGNDLHISGGKSQLRLRTMPIEDWPSIKPVTENEVYLDADTLAAFSFVTHAASTDKTRPALQGIALDPEGFVVATDSNRLACYKIPAGLPAIVLPMKIIGPVLKNSKDCLLYVNEMRASFRTEDTVWTTRLIAEPFPSIWKTLIPETEFFIEVNRQTLREALKHMEILTSQYVAAVEIGVAGTSGLRLSVHTQEDSIEELVEADTDFDDTFLLNPAYLRQALEVLEEETVRIGVPGSISKPLMLKSGDLTLLVMRMRGRA